MILALALGGCVEAATEVSTAAISPAPIERRAGVSLAEATIAVVSVDGAPAAVSAAFTADLRREAKSRDIAVVGPRRARYLARGYLSASADSGGVAFAYVWDVFGPNGRRAQRLEDVVVAKGASGGDPWAAADAEALNGVAAKSADDLAAFLSNTPDAKPTPPAVDLAAAQ